MAVRQYIGARYVPRFSDVNNGVWSNVYEYEPLTIVKHGNDYYTSRQTVPVGTDITNTDYWLMTGNYNGAITELGNRIDDLNTDLQSKIDNVNDALTLQYNAITGRNLKIILVGDSYGTRNGSGSTVLLSDVGDELRTLTARMNATIYNVSQNGAGFCNGRFIANLQAQRNAMSDVEASEVTDVFVFGGWNDTIGRNGQTIAQLQTAQSEFSNYCLANFPNARMHLAFVSYSMNVTSEADGLSQTYMYYQIAYRYGFITHDLHNAIAITSRVVSDGSHPNQDGVAWIARGIYECINNGNFMFAVSTFYEFTSSKYQYGGNHYIGFQMDEHGVEIVPYTRYLSNTFRFVPATGTTLTMNLAAISDVNLVIGTLTGYMSNAGRRLMCPVSGFISYDPATPKTVGFDGGVYCDGYDVHLLINDMHIWQGVNNVQVNRITFNMTPSGKQNGLLIRMTT